MTRLIDANKLKMYFDTCQFCEKCPDIAFMCQISCEFPNILTPQWERAIDEQPTVDAVPVRHGKWIKLDMHEHLADHKCTACGQECYVPTCMGEPMYIYCPNCGADMRGEDNE